MVKNIKFYDNWEDLNKSQFEIVERKGLGHPDTLADGLAEAVSNVYSSYCLKNFGIVPHHNVDKLYIGAGLFSVDIGKNAMIKPAIVRINGRVSNCFGKNEINLVELQEQAVSQYLSRILPRAVVGKNIFIDHNATQNTRRKNWFSPQSVEDLPELKRLVANDTSVCVAHAPLSYAEKICMIAEKFFWIVDDSGQALKPKFSDIGQDIKVMVIRKGNDIDVNMCVPVFSDTISDMKGYECRIKQIEALLYDEMKKLDLPSEMNISININNTRGGSVHPYMLALGSCIECGEEGLVGRGNGITGLIPTMRAKSNEAYFGKNPVYHVGRVIGLLCQRIANRIYNETKSGNSVYILSVHSDDLMQPSSICVSLENMQAKDIAEKIIAEELNKEDYLKKIIGNIITSDFSMKVI